MLVALAWAVSGCTAAADSSDRAVATSSQNEQPVPVTEARAVLSAVGGSGAAGIVPGRGGLRVERLSGWVVAAGGAASRGGQPSAEDPDAGGRRRGRLAATPSLHTEERLTQSADVRTQR